MLNRRTIAVACLTIVLYLAAILVGLHVRNFSFFRLASPSAHHLPDWTPPRFASIPSTPLGDSIRRGALLFDETPLYASAYTHSRIACASCHAEGGIQPFASPMVGMPADFPMFNPRAGHIISLKDRVQECMVRSENGQPLPYDGPDMQALLDYIAWLSQPEPQRKPYLGRGLIHLPDLVPDPQNGQQIYAAQCAGCHGTSGQGSRHIFPPLWGPDSFNDGAGMHSIPKMAAFVQHNMPQNRMGILTPQQAYDVSAYIHAQPRPAFNPAYKHF
jgi:thiosulfate dehydrogenase